MRFLASLGMTDSEHGKKAGGGVAATCYPTNLTPSEARNLMPLLQPFNRVW
jgi:hypothetical protein